MDQERKKARDSISPWLFTAEILSVWKGEGRKLATALLACQPEGREFWSFQTRL